MGTGFAQALREVGRLQSDLAVGRRAGLGRGAQEHGQGAQAQQERRAYPAPGVRRSGSVTAFNPASPTAPSPPPAAVPRRSGGR
ncbi:hypothetical protein GCM10018771_30730 [Streptomyces cellulosae]|nr:hypothetical protein GCM10018771_30730 [Streptomyces cellulosae]